MAKLHTLVDTFSSGTTPAIPRWGNYYGTPTISSGQCRLSCVSTYEGIFSGTTYDLTDSSFTAQFVSIPTGGNNSRSTVMEVQVDANNKIDMGHLGDGTLYCRKIVAGVTTTLASATYNSSTHKWWRIQHDTVTGTGFVSFWYSANGYAWTQLGGAHNTGLTLTSVFAHIYCGYFGTETAPPDTVVDNVNNPSGAGFAGYAAPSVTANNVSTPVVFAPAGLASASGSVSAPAARVRPAAPAAAATAAGQGASASTGVGGGITTLFGVYGGYGSLGGISATNAHESLVGRPVQVATDYLPHGTWSDFNATTMRTYQLDPWRDWRDDRPGSKFVYGIPILTDDDPGDFSGVAAGTYDAHFTVAGNALVAAGHADAIIMLGWEPNNSGIGPWQATDNPSGYVSAFTHVVTLLRGLSGQNFTFLLESSLGLQGGHTLDAFADYYPGNSYVDYIGMNVYDMKPGDPSISAANRWNWIKTQTMGLDDHVAFVASKGKPNVCAEWGLYAPNGTPDLDGGGDNPYFIACMAEYFADNDVYFQSYFNFDWGGGNLADFPNGEDEYVEKFSVPPNAGTSSAFGHV